MPDDFGIISASVYHIVYCRLYERWWRPIRCWLDRLRSSCKSRPIDDHKCDFQIVRRWCLCTTYNNRIIRFDSYGCRLRPCKGIFFFRPAWWSKWLNALSQSLWPSAKTLLTAFILPSSMKFNTIVQWIAPNDRRYQIGSSNSSSKCALIRFCF